MGFVFKPPNICGFIIFFVRTPKAVPRLQPDIPIASTSTAVHAPRKLEGEGPNFAQSTCIWYMFHNSKMPFGSGFVFSRIHITELIFNKTGTETTSAVRFVQGFRSERLALAPRHGSGHHGNTYTHNQIWGPHSVPTSLVVSG